MTPDDCPALLAELAATPRDDGFRYALDDLAAAWRSRGVGLEGVEAVLTFIEREPELDYGAPGALVHFAEEWRHRGYEAALFRSFARAPTVPTAWMVQRLLNGAGDAAERAACRAALERAAADPGLAGPLRADLARYLAKD